MGDWGDWGMLIALTKGAKTASFLMITHRDHKALKIVLTEIEIGYYNNIYLFFVTRRVVHLLVCIRNR